MIAQGWGGAAGRAGNTEWQAAIVDVEKSWNMHAKVSKNVNAGANVNAAIDATMEATMDAAINANISIL
jgi:hypothetical protein